MKSIKFFLVFLLSVSSLRISAFVVDDSNFRLAKKLRKFIWENHRANSDDVWKQFRNLHNIKFIHMKSGTIFSASNIITIYNAGTFREPDFKFSYLDTEYKVSNIKGLSVKEASGDGSEGGGGHVNPRRVNLESE